MSSVLYKKEFHSNRQNKEKKGAVNHSYRVRKETNSQSYSSVG